MDSSQNSSHDPSQDASPEEKKNSRRPANTAFRQQRLKAWQPILTPKNVIWIFSILGVFAAVISSVHIDYTTCFRDAPEDKAELMPADLVKSYWRLNGSDTMEASWKRTTNVTYSYNNYNVTGLTNCTLQFRILQDMSPPIEAYYHLENFYQNHRRYVTSFHADQLLGKNVTTSDLKGSACDPLAIEDNKAIYPCGLIANSIFNDTIGLPRQLGTDCQGEACNYFWDEKGIAWASDLELYGPLQNSNYDNIKPPPNWRIRYPNESYSADHPPPNLKEDEHFVTWMRTAALPSFYKPWAFNRTNKLVAGQYAIDIVDNFRMTEYNAKKSLVITTSGPLGGRNDLPGILWLALAGFFFLMALLFVVGNFIRPRKLGDHTLLSWNKVPPSSGAKGKGKAPAGPNIGMSTGRDL
ncbi:CDC50 family protein [Xylariaceae sp. FL1651]|nr:CDC50 family protein [Xylariaceae sp. FL1651]